MAKPKIVKQQKTNIATKEVRGNEPANFETQNFVWHVGWIDTQHEFWGWKRISFDDWWSNILPKLRNFESMTWAEIQRAGGGRSNGNNSHSITIDDLSKIANARLSEIELDDIDELFSLRLEGVGRIYGIRDGRILKILWYDHFHGDPKRAVCPVQKR